MQETVACNQPAKHQSRFPSWVFTSHRPNVTDRTSVEVVVLLLYGRVLSSARPSRDGTDPNDPNPLKQAPRRSRVRRRSSGHIKKPQTCFKVRKYNFLNRRNVEELETLSFAPLIPHPPRNISLDCYCTPFVFRAYLDQGLQQEGSVERTEQSVSLQLAGHNAVHPNARPKTPASRHGGL